MEDLISVVVPVYNAAPYIANCLDSILNQTYEQVEIIAVDDGSTDRSGFILDEYKKRYPGRIKVIHKENGGVTSARLAGIETSEGEWIGFVDGDDEIEPKMYEHLLRNAIKYHADISHCGYQMVFPDGRIRFFYNTNVIMEQDRDKGLTDLLQNELIEPSLCIKLFKHDLFAGLKERIDLSIKINEDLLMNFLLFKEANKSIFGDFCPYHYLVHSSSASRQKLNQNRIFDPVIVKQQILELSPSPVRGAAERALFNTLLDVYNNMTFTGRHSFLTEKEKVRQLILDSWYIKKSVGIRRNIIAWMIRLFPTEYPLFYRIYARYFQSSPYA